MARHHVKFDNLTQTQFAVGMLSVIEKQPKNETKNSMRSLVSQIQRDMIDFGFKIILCITSVILTALEENMIEWMDSDNIEVMRKMDIKFRFSEL